MKVYTFKVEEHEEYGSLGFKPSWYPNGAPLGGMTAAHDILEHFPNDNGGAESEFLALGAALWIRGDSGYTFNPPEENIAVDLPTVWDYHTHRDNRFTLAPCSAVRDADLMGRCRKIVKLGLENFDELSLEKPDMKARELIARWIAKGYKKAEARYKNLDNYTLAFQIFKKIQEKTDSFLNMAEIGMILTVRLDLRRCEVSLDCGYPDFEDEY